MSSTRILRSLSSLGLSGIAGIMETLLMKEISNSEISLWDWHGWLYYVIMLVLLYVLDQGERERKFDFQQNIKRVILSLLILVSSDLSFSISNESRTPGLEVFLKQKSFLKQTWRGDDNEWQYLILSFDDGSFIFTLEWISALDIFLILS